MNYDIHGILKVRINIDGIIPSIFKIDGSFEVPDVDIIVVRNPALKIRPSSEILVSELQGFTRVYYKWRAFVISELLDILLGNFLDKGYLINNVIIPLKLLQKGYVVIHSACVSYENQGILIVAPPDTGKTYTALTLVNKSGFEFLSDDLTIVKENVAYCYPVPLTLKFHHLKSIRVSTRAKLIAKLKKLRKMVYFKGADTVSYTHLTLPTTERV